MWSEQRHKRLCNGETMYKLTVVLIVAMVISGCILSEDSEKDSGDSKVSAGDYMPKKMAGSSHVWRVTTTETETGASAETTRTDTIAGTVSIDGQTWYLSTNDADTDTLVFSIDGNVIRVRSNDAVFGWGTNISPSVSPPVENCRMYDFSAPLDVKRIIMERGSQTETHYINYDITGMYTGRESVTVPAGSFDGCPRFEVEIGVRFTPIVTGETVQFTVRQVTWFGNGTGPVRREWTLSRNGRHIRHGVETLERFNAAQ